MVPAREQPSDTTSYHELISFGKRKNGQTSEKLREKSFLHEKGRVFVNQNLAKCPRHLAVKMLKNRLDLARRGFPNRSMTLEQAVLAALSAVVAALIYQTKRLDARSAECEEWRRSKGPEIETMKQSIGQLSTVAMIANGCKVQGCMLAGKLAETFSVKKQQKPEELTNPSNP